jgi:hypothetical protein
MKLSPRDMEIIKSPFDVYLKEKQYTTLRDEHLQKALREMVSHHYCDHLKLAADLTRRDKKVRTSITVRLECMFI